MSLPRGYGGAPQGQPAPQTGVGAWSDGSQWSQFQQSVPQSSARAPAQAGYGQFQQAPPLNMPGQIPGAAGADFAATSGWQGHQASFQPQYPGYTPQQPRSSYPHQHPGYPHQHPGYPHQQSTYAQPQTGYQQQPLATQEQFGFPQQQAQYQLQQQKLLEEQARRAKEQQEQKEAEERRQRELEKQKLALMNINIAKPQVAGSDLESRIGLSFEKAAASSKPKPAQTIVTTMSTDSIKGKPVSESSLTQGLPVLHGSEVAPTTLPDFVSALEMGVIAPPTDVKQIAAITTSVGPSVDDLVAESLSNLKLTHRPVSKTDFKKFSQPGAAVERAPSPATMQKKYTSSEKSHNWMQSADFSGIFAEHSQHEFMHEPGALPPQDPLLGATGNGLGDLHSVQLALLPSHPSIPVPPSGGSSAGPGSQATACQALARVKFPGTAPVVAVPPSGSPQLTRSYNQPQQSSLPATSAAKFSATDLPFWLAPCLHGPAPVPPAYGNVYQMCSIQGSELTNTEKLFPLLMSSGLDRAVLGQLWSAANLTVPGQLTRLELFVLLGLIGLVQEGKPGTLAELKVTTQAPIPRFALLQAQVPLGRVTLPVATRPVAQPVAPAVSDDFGEFQASATPPLPRTQHPPPARSPNVSLGTGEPSLQGVPPISVATGPQPNPPVVGLQLDKNPLHSQSTKKTPADDPYAALRALAPVDDSTSGHQDSSDRYAAFKDMSSQDYQLPLLENPLGHVTRGGAGALSSVTGAASIEAKSSAGFSTLQPASLSVGWQTPATSTPAAVSTAANMSSDNFSSFASFATSSVPIAQIPTAITTVSQKSTKSNAFTDLNVLPTKTSVTKENGQPPPASSDLDELNLFPAKVVVTSASVQPFQVSSSFDELNLFPAKVAVTSASVQPFQVSSSFDELNLFPAKVPATTASIQSHTSSSGFEGLSLFPANAPATLASVGSLPPSSASGELNLLPTTTMASFSTEPPAFSSSTVTTTTAADHWADFSGFVSSSHNPPTTSATPNLGTTLDLFLQQPAQVPKTAASSQGVFDDFANFTGLVATPIVPTTTASNGTSVLDALPQMESKEVTSRTSSTSEFGEFAQFQPARSSSTSTDPGLNTAGSKVKLIGQYEMWKKCLSKCCELLEASVTTLSEVSDTSILEEIARSEEARNKLRGIAELFRFAKRIHVASKGPGKKMMSPTKYESLNDSMMEVKKHWNAIVKLLPNNVMTQILDSMSSSAALSDEDSQTCFICLLPKHIFISPLVTIDGCSDQYTLETTEQNGRLLHIQCANFWTRGLGESLTFLEP